MAYPHVSIVCVYMVTNDYILHAQTGLGTLYSHSSACFYAHVNILLLITRIFLPVKKITTPFLKAGHPGSYLSSFCVILYEFGVYACSCVV